MNRWSFKAALATANPFAASRLEMSVEIDATQIKVLREDHLEGLNSQSICILIINYNPPLPKNIWANAEYLQTIEETLEEFQSKASATSTA